MFIGKVTAIKGTYVVFGITIAGILYQEGTKTIESVNHQLTQSNQINRWCVKATLFIVGVTFLITYITGVRLVVVVISLTIGYTLVAYQLISNQVNEMMAYQLALLFLIGPVTKYLTTGFYFGATDLLDHVRAVELLYRTGDLDSIGTVYATYNSFPALHITAGATSSFTGLSKYDGILILGILTYAVVVLAVYHVGREWLSPGEGITVALVFSALSIVQYYTTYFFPQALATALGFLALYVLVRRISVQKPHDATLSAIIVILALTLAFAHHVTQILFAGIMTVLYIPSAIRETKIGRKLNINRGLPQPTGFLLLVVVGVTYLVSSRPDMGAYFLQFTSRKFLDPFVSDTGGQRAVFGFGTDIPYHDPSTAIKSVFHVDGLFFIGITALFTLGAVTILFHFRRFLPIAGVVILGVVSSMAVLKTPLLNTVQRLSLPLSLFFSIIAGIGLWSIVSGSNESGSGLDGPNYKCDSKEPSGRSLAVAGLIILLGVTGPLVAGDDLYGLHAGPNMWETYSTPEQQVEFSEQELRELDALTEHVDRHAPNVTMLSITDRANNICVT